MIIGEGIGSCPLQYSLGKLHTMTSIIEKQGSGWDKINVKEFFKTSEVYRREDVPMTTTKEYEECNIMFSTMHSIRKTVKTPMRFSVSWINIKSVIIQFEKGTQECSETNITIFSPQMI